MNLKLGTDIIMPGYQGREPLIYTLDVTEPCKINIFATTTAISEDGYWISIERHGEVPAYPPTSPVDSPMLITYELTADGQGEDGQPAPLKLAFEGIICHAEEYAQGVADLQAALYAEREAAAAD